MGKCSGGQQQRLRFALALLPDPDLIVLDEPTTGHGRGGPPRLLDRPAGRRPRGRTILFATHYLEEADAYADRIVLVSHGRIVADGSAAQVKNLASGRLVSATLPDVTAAQTGGARGDPGRPVGRAARRPVLVRTSDSDGVARHLLTATAATRHRDHRPRARGRVPRPDRRPRHRALGAPHERRRPPPSPPPTARRPRRRAPAWSTARSSPSSCAGCCATAATVIFTLDACRRCSSCSSARPTRTRRSRSATATSPRSSWSRWPCTAR